MIIYETSPSTFFEGNKAVLEKMKAELLDFTFSGWCNAYGYDVNGVNKDGTISINYLKYQTTQNGLYIPINAKDTTELRFTCRLQNTQLSYYFHRFWLKKLFRKITFRNNIFHAQIEKMDSFISDNSIYAIQINNGEMKIHLNTPLKTPSEQLQTTLLFIKTL